MTALRRAAAAHLPLLSPPSRTAALASKESRRRAARDAVPHGLRVRRKRRSRRAERQVVPVKTVHSSTMAAFMPLVRLPDLDQTTACQGASTVELAMMPCGTGS